MSAHTPGPWRQAHRQKASGIYDTEIFDAEGKTIATIAWYARTLTTDGATTTFCDENAHVIAAAPELLQALVDLRDCIEDGREPSLSDANRAIRKATGAAA